MTLELSQLTHQVREMGKSVAERQRTYADLVQLAREWLVDYADQGAAMRHPAREYQAAIPTDEPLDAVHPLPSMPALFTVVAADGSQIQPDRHGAALYTLINIGSLVYRHGSGAVPEARSEAILGYTEDDLYEDGAPVAGNLLDVRRDLAELRRLADVCDDERSIPTVALVDGSIVLWVLRDRPHGARSAKVTAYLNELERIRRSGGIVGGFISRPGYSEVTRLLTLLSFDGDTKRASEQPNPLEHLPDRAVFAMLPPGARSALFASPKEVNQEAYARQGQEVRFLYLNVAKEEEEAVIARVEVPAWVAGSPDKLKMIHGAIVAQARITGEYPYALARADELAYISVRERAALEEMLVTELLRAGVRSAPSPKAAYKRLTRQGV
ncbi:MAG: DNA double-strand break repair nuclease NurA [Anaerolineae bacterium]|jgi:hypothetical protein